MPVTFPDAFGYASATRGAFSGPSAPTIYTVTTLIDTGLAGSLRYGLETLTGPRVIIFNVGGYFPLGDIIAISSPYVTIAGQTAPSPGVEIQKYGFFITSHDMVIQHIAIRPGEWGQGRQDNCGMIAYDTGAHDLFFDHVSCTWGPDENFATDKYGAAAANITFFRCLTAECLDFPASVPLSASHGLLVQSPTKLVNVSQCLFANNRERNPYAQSGTRTVYTNNYIYNWFVNWAFFWAFFDITGNPGTEPIFSSVIGNYNVVGPQTRDTSPTWGSNDAFLFYLSNGGGLGGAAASRIYKSDNTASNSFGVNLIEVGNEWGVNPFVNAPPAETPLAGFSIWASSLVPTWVPVRAGTRPADRPAVDVRILAYVAALGGPGYIRHQNEVGGYPPLTPTTWTLVPPVNFTDTNPTTGYTYGEDWLYTYKELVEGVTINVPEGLPPVTELVESGDTVIIGGSGSTFPAGTLCISGWGQSAGFKFLSPDGVDLGQPASAPTGGSGSGIEAFQTLKPSGHIAVLGAGDTFPTTSAGLWEASDFTVRAEMTDASHGTGEGFDVDDSNHWYGYKTNKSYLGGETNSIITILQYDVDANFVQEWDVITGPKNGGFAFDVESIGVNGAGTIVYVYGRAAGFIDSHTFPPKVYSIDLAGAGTWLDVFVDDGMDYTARVGEMGIIGLTSGHVLVAWWPQAGPGYIKRYNAAGVEQATYVYAVGDEFGFDPVFLAHGLTESTFWVGAYNGGDTYSSWVTVEFDVATGDVLHEFIPEDGEFQFDSAFTVLRVAISGGFTPPPPVPGPPIATNTIECHTEPGSASPGTGQVLPPIAGTITLTCAGGGDVPTAADVTDSESWE